ncbi:MAG: UDP-N-acetylmuramoyl-tripeptide--D-alanyl-D-alanine ligase [Bacteroidota bacterium]|nr:UDP-N-acetylmuramoyl-tripeptide--D-alanyl-D-alanine ligase [Bacteroidota bacterium]MDP4206348.1 UDP-N-acetylmuramoyl-tripeptide--D-alanyl-D-alanine ligase [Bacteroidota bacterium]
MQTEQLYQIFLKFPQVITDSRKASPGTLFFALKGDNFDGNTYASKALESGCEYAIIDNPEFYLNEKTILVEDTLIALQKLAAFHRKTLGLPILSITGTNGKTTTKELVHAVLSKKFRTIATTGNLNNHIGVPLTLLSITPDIEMAVVEMGANHPGEIATLCEIAQPDFGLITNIGKAHLEGFGSFEGIKKTKGELYRFLEKHQGRIFINKDNPILKEISGNLPRFTYGTDDNAELQGEILDTASMFLYFRALYPKGWLYHKTNLVGNYNFENAMAAAAIGLYFGVDPLLIQKAIEEYKPQNLRSQLIRKENNTILLDAYNANPTSMRASLNNFIKMKPHKPLLILGDMLELGASSAEEHQKIIELAIEGRFKNVILVGEQFGNTSTPDGYLKFTTSKEVAEFLKQTPPEGNTILIKGSRGIKLEGLVELIS